MIVRLSEHKSGTLILDSERLSRSSSYLAALFLTQKGWLKPDTMIKGDDGSPRLVYGMNLVFDRLFRIGYISGDVNISISSILLTCIQGGDHQV